MKILLIGFLCFASAFPAVAAEHEDHCSQGVYLNPEFAYKMSKDGWFFQWGDGHRYNGEIEEAKEIWWTTFMYGIVTVVGGGLIATGQSVKSHATSTQAKRIARDRRAALTALGGAFAGTGVIGYTYTRNEDISTAPLHTVTFNLKFK